ncbi:hypothetical protein SNEBB_009971 [Seison nebaliae]|nr:hypothetical protein SNEBB_009971 [Seison nebaliae]
MDIFNNFLKVHSLNLDILYEEDLSLEKIIEKTAKTDENQYKHYLMFHSILPINRFIIISTRLIHLIHESYKEFLPFFLDECLTRTKNFIRHFSEWRRLFPIDLNLRPFIKQLDNRIALYFEMLKQLNESLVRSSDTKCLQRQFRQFLQNLDQKIDSEKKVNKPSDILIHVIVNNRVECDVVYILLSHYFKDFKLIIPYRYSFFDELLKSFQIKSIESVFLLMKYLQMNNIDRIANYYQSDFSSNRPIISIHYNEDDRIFREKIYLQETPLITSTLEMNKILSNIDTKVKEIDYEIKFPKDFKTVEYQKTQFKPPTFHIRGTPEYQLMVLYLGFSEQQQKYIERVVEKQLETIVEKELVLIPQTDINFIIKFFKECFHQQLLSPFILLVPNRFHENEQKILNGLTVETVLKFIEHFIILFESFRKDSYHFHTTRQIAIIEELYFHLLNNLPLFEKVFFQLLPVCKFSGLIRFSQIGYTHQTITDDQLTELKENHITNVSYFNQIIKAKRLTITQNQKNEFEEQYLFVELEVYEKMFNLPDCIKKKETNAFFENDQNFSKYYSVFAKLDEHNNYFFFPTKTKTSPSKGDGDNTEKLSLAHVPYSEKICALHVNRQSLNEPITNTKHSAVRYCSPDHYADLCNDRLLFKRLRLKKFLHISFFFISKMKDVFGIVDFCDRFQSFLNIHIIIDYPFTINFDRDFFVDNLIELFNRNDDDLYFHLKRFSNKFSISTTCEISDKIQVDYDEQCAKLKELKLLKKLFIKNSERIHLRFEEIMQVLTTKSVINLNNLEFPEFLGDSLLDFIMALYAFNLRDTDKDMTNLKSDLTENRYLMNLSRKHLPLKDNIIRMSFEYQNNFVPSFFSAAPESLDPKSIADSIEALMALLYVKGGFDLTLEFFRHFFGKQFNILCKLVTEQLDMTPHENSEYETFSRSILRYKFHDLNLLKRSLLMRNVSNTVNNESLEFLGDAILDFLVTLAIIQYLMEKKLYDCLTPGKITLIRSNIVCNVTFSVLAYKHKFYKYAYGRCLEEKREDFENLFNQFSSDSRTGKNIPIDINRYLELENDQYLERDVQSIIHKIRENRTATTHKKRTLLEFQIDEAKTFHKIFSDMFESVAAAVYIDSGNDIELTWKVFHPFLATQIVYACENVQKTVKARLHEMNQTVDFQTENKGNLQTLVNCRIIIENHQYVIKMIGRNRKLITDRLSYRIVKALEQVDLKS